MVVHGGDAPLASALEEALDVPREDDSSRQHVHGFHSYAARLHPLTAHALIERLTDPTETVLDPFMGSGTVLVEARLLGRRAQGTDLNPLSPDLVHLKTRGSTEAERRTLLEAGERAAEHADERRITRAGPTHKYDREDLELFDVHMLLELDGLMQGIGLLPAGFTREALKLVLSSILVKVSKQPGDTVERTSPRRLAKGFAIRLFQKKTEELVTRLAEFQALLPAGAPPCQTAMDDARELRSVTTGSIDLVLASPPYPGIYDYARHHAARLRWLGLDAGAFERGEMGARRKLRAMSRDDAIDAWAEDFVKGLTAIRRVLSPNGAATLVLADSVVQGRALYADDAMERLVPRSGLTLVATASQKRPHFHEPTRDAFRNRPRHEHVFVLVPEG